MSKPVVAIVGRPNVGKSTLFNVLAGSTISIVKDTPGVTRDRIYADCTWLNHAFTLIDTGGIEPDSKDIILSQMREQAQIAIDTADVIPAKSSEIKNINPSAEPTTPSSPKIEARETKISPGPSLALDPCAT